MCYFYFHYFQSGLFLPNINLCNERSYIEWVHVRFDTVHILMQPRLLQAQRRFGKPEGFEMLVAVMMIP